MSEDKLILCTTKILEHYHFFFRRWLLSIFYLPNFTFSLQWNYMKYCKLQNVFRGTKSKKEKMKIKTQDEKIVETDICRKPRISLVTSSQLNMSLVNWRKVMQTCEALDFWGLHKNKNCAFPLRKERSLIQMSF